MAKSGGQPGNKNAAKAREFLQGIRRALAHKYGSAPDGYFEIAKLLVECAEEKESWAIKEIADRVDGKPQQAMDVKVTEMTHEDWLNKLDE